VLLCHTDKQIAQTPPCRLPGILYTATRHSPSRRNLVVAAHARPTDSSHRCGECEMPFTGPVACLASKRAALNHPSQPLGRALMHDVSSAGPLPRRQMRPGAARGLWHRISLVRPAKLCQAKLGRVSVPRRSRLDPLHASALPQRRSTKFPHLRKPGQGARVCIRPMLRAKVQGFRHFRTTRIPPFCIPDCLRFLYPRYSAFPEACPPRARGLTGAAYYIYYAPMINIVYNTTCLVCGLKAKLTSERAEYLHQ
jgi:hypothetical protein